MEPITDLNGILSVYGMCARFLEIARDAAREGGSEYFERAVAEKAMEKAGELALIAGLIVGGDGVG